MEPAASLHNPSVLGLLPDGIFRAVGGGSKPALCEQGVHGHNVARGKPGEYFSFQNELLRPK